MENQCGPDILRDIDLSIPLSLAYPHCAPFGQNIGSKLSVTGHQQCVCNQITQKSVVL